METGDEELGGEVEPEDRGVSLYNFVLDSFDLVFSPLEAEFREALATLVERKDSGQGTGDSSLSDAP